MKRWFVVALLVGASLLSACGENIRNGSSSEVWDGDNPVVQQKLQACVDTNGVPAVVPAGNYGQVLYVYCVHKGGEK